MHPSLPPTVGFLPHSQQQLLTELIQKIVGAVRPEKIICYGIRSVHYQDWGTFLERRGIKEDARLAIDLLIIAPSTKGQTEQDINQAAEHCCKQLADVCCVTHKIHTVNEGLSNGNPFFCALYHHGLMIYDSGQTALLHPGIPGNEFKSQSELESIWSRWYGLASNFYNSAVESLKYQRPDLTTFMLHQAVEHTCGALIRIYTGYRPNTHNLSRLLQMAESFTRGLKAIFPKSTKEEEEIYGIIQRGYLDARYKDEYNVPASTLLILINRVQQFQEVAADLHSEKMSQYLQPSFNRIPDSPAFP